MRTLKLTVSIRSARRVLHGEVRRRCVHCTSKSYSMYNESLEVPNGRTYSDHPAPVDPHTRRDLLGGQRLSDGGLSDSHHARHRSGGRPVRPDLDGAAASAALPRGGG